VDDLIEAWFCREVLPHEAGLMRFLGRRVGNVLAEDIRHDIYVRVLESAEIQRPTSPKAFLFKTARNLLIDRARRDRIVSIESVEDLDGLNVLLDEASPERTVSGRQQLQKVSIILGRMSKKSRDVLLLRRIEGLSQREVAQRLSITEAAVEKHVYRALRTLANALFGEAQPRDEISNPYVRENRDVE
jgi:RNA polymerase sigma-70 factor (ECF subfamily)